MCARVHFKSWSDRTIESSLMFLLRIICCNQSKRGARRDSAQIEAQMAHERADGASGSRDAFWHAARVK